MTYKLTFLLSAKREWDKLDTSIQKLFKAKIRQILENPHLPKNKLVGLTDCYKIKLPSLGYIMVYKVNDNKITIQIIAIGKRDKNEVYRAVYSRLKN